MGKNEKKKNEKKKKNVGCSQEQLAEAQGQFAEEACKLRNAADHREWASKWTVEELCEAATISCKDWGKKESALEYGSVNKQFPFFLYKALLELDKETCLVCKESLLDGPIVLSHDWSHGTRMEDNVKLCSADACKPFADKDPINLLVSFPLFSLIHLGCNSSASNSHCSTCGKACDLLYHHAKECRGGPRLPLDPEKEWARRKAHFLSSYGMEQQEEEEVVVV